MGTTLGLRGLQHQKTGNITVGTTEPSTHEGSSGDITIRNINGVIKLYAKYNNVWYGRDLGNTLLVGDTNKKHVAIDSSGMDIRSSFGNSVAKFGDTLRIGKLGTGESNVVISSTGIDLRLDTTPKLSLDSSGNVTAKGIITIQTATANGDLGLLLENDGNGYNQMILKGANPEIHFGYSGSGASPTSDIEGSGKIFLNREDHTSTLTTVVFEKAGVGQYALGEHEGTFRIVDSGNVKEDADRALYITSSKKVYLPGVYNDNIGAERDLLINSSGQLGYDGSSSVFKDNISSSAGMLSTINALRVVSYNRKVLDDDGIPTNTNNIMVEYGLLAEELSSRIPSVCYKATAGEKRDLNLTTDYIGISYKRLTPFLIKAIQELSDKVDTLEGYHVRR